MAVISSDYTHKRQDLLLERLVERPQGKLRTQVRRNAYDFQSYAVCSVWTQSGWQEVTRLDGDNERMAALPNYVTQDDFKAEQALTEVAELLEARAMKVIGRIVTG